MTAQTEPQALPEARPHDADRRARLVINEVDQLLMQREYDSAEIVVKRAIRAAVEAEREGCAKRVRQFQDLVGWQEGESRNALIGEIEAAIRARGEAS